MRKFRSVALVAGVSLLGSACGSSEAPEAEQQKLTWEAFRASVVEDPEGKLIFDGDMALDSEEELRAFFDNAIAAELGTARGGLAVYNTSPTKAVSGDVRWSATQARNLTYCVSSTFGANKTAVVNAMNAATAAWEAAANVNFTHLTQYDSSCTASQANVLFDVRPVNAGGQYLARAFFPNSGRSGRNVLVDGSAFGNISPWTLTGIMRHELGHVLGFRHEHTRSTGSGCYEDSQWRALTSTYDRSSVMHYPQCNGTQTRDLVLTSLDQQGARALYP
ncbi:M57 family metalloprotease [Corallococcus macrosporus]|uniref:Lipoprotein n=2 Tax=Myxococcaceae TaxID=31 RepID=A0A250JMW9_9BACT|nr:M57 family metalloprotease [Corallococcus macrosporus]AEI63150.1 putative lipoprotein [Corallococcus macrosporus]ATB44970.1 lipoprotein [Corallococcus macrosporus DSM 14697]